MRFENKYLKYYRETKYDVHQLTELQQGLTEGLDISKFANPSFKCERMKYIRLSLKNGFYNKVLSDPSVEDGSIKEFYTAHYNGIDLSKYLADYNCSQLKEIRLALTKGIDLSEIMTPRMSVTAIFHLRRLLNFNKTLDIENLRILVNSGILESEGFKFQKF